MIIDTLISVRVASKAFACGNQPPHGKFPKMFTLTPVPETIDPDRLLSTLTGGTYKRKLDSKGCLQLGNQTYYVQQQRHGQTVLIWVGGKQRIPNVNAGNVCIKKLSIKGLQNRSMNFRGYLDLMCKEAVLTWRRTLRRTLINRQGHDVILTALGLDVRKQVERTVLSVRSTCTQHFPRKLLLVH
jgi:hypothetical protein